MVIGKNLEFIHINKHEFIKVIVKNLTSVGSTTSYYWGHINFLPGKISCTLIKISERPKW